MKPVTVFCTLLSVCAFAGPVRAQTFDHLQIAIEGWVININGGEQPNTAAVAGPLVLGQTTHAAFSKMPNMCGFGVTGYEALQAEAISGWLVDVTPIRVGDNDAVTFRLHWTRGRDPNPGPALFGSDVELTLRPGQSTLIDTVPLSPNVTMPYQRCGVRATALRVNVDYWPRPETDRRLVNTELWLVERLPDGSERGQALSLRGQFNQASPFYFDSLADGRTTLDLFGEFTLVADGDVFALALKVKSRLVDNGQVSTSLRESGNYFRSRSVDTTVRLRQGEVVGVELPRLSENESGAFAGRTYSIRIRTRQIR